MKSEGQTQAQAAQSALQTAASDEQTLRETPDENLSEESASRTQIRKGPASDKETLLMQFPKDGRIQVLSEIAEKDDDTVSFIMTEPSLKNVAAFYEILNCRELAAKKMCIRDRAPAVADRGCSTADNRSPRPTPADRSGSAAGLRQAP